MHKFDGRNNRGCDFVGCPIKGSLQKESMISEEFPVTREPEWQCTDVVTCDKERKQLHASSKKNNTVHAVSAEKGKKSSRSGE